MYGDGGGYFRVVIQTMIQKVLPHLQLKMNHNI